MSGCRSMFVRMIIASGPTTARRLPSLSRRIHGIATP